MWSGSDSNAGSRRLSSSGLGFVVRHYAGPVHYSPLSLLKKNKDLVPAELVTLFAQSDGAFVAALMDHADNNNMKRTAEPQQLLGHGPAMGTASPSNGTMLQTPDASSQQQKASVTGLSCAL